MKNLIFIIFLIPLFAFSQNEDYRTDSTITMIEIGTVNLEEAVRYTQKDSSKTTVVEREEIVYYSIPDSNYVDSVWVYEETSHDSTIIKLDTVSETVNYQVRQDISIDSLLIEKCNAKTLEKQQDIARLERAENRIKEQKNPILEDLKAIRKLARNIKNKGHEKAQRRLMNISESGEQGDEAEVLKKILLKRGYTHAEDLKGDYKRSSAIKRLANELGLSSSGNMGTVAERIFEYINQ